MRAHATAMLACLTVVAPAFASCAPKLPWCQRLPNRQDSSTAIFVGVVKRIVLPSAAVAAPFPAPVERLPSGRHWSGGDPVRSIARQYPVVTFEVVERFLGAGAAEFELRLTSDVFLGAIPKQTPPFVEGQAWFVEAYFDTLQRDWMTSHCERNKLAEHAQEDLSVLRTWAAGGRLPARVSGQVANATEPRRVSRALVELRGTGVTLSTTTDHNGAFAFENLEPGVYEAFTEGARPRKVDLTRSWCSIAVLLRE